MKGRLDLRDRCEWQELRLFSTIWLLPGWSMACELVTLATKLVFSSLIRALLRWIEIWDSFTVSTTAWLALDCSSSEFFTASTFEAFVCSFFLEVMSDLLEPFRFLARL